MFVYVNNLQAEFKIIYLPRYLAVPYKRKMRAMDFKTKKLIEKIVIGGDLAKDVWSNEIILKHRREKKLSAVTCVAIN